jgi:hypothetical protein
MQHRSMRRRGLGLLVGLCAASISAALGVQAASAQQTTRPTRSATAAPAAKPQARGLYYVDFRARTAASYGHAFVWFGRTDQRTVDVAGLHPATDSVIPYLLGHVIPVPSETGASYGDLDEQYVTASYRVHMNEPEGKRVFAYIKRLQATSPVWNAATYNCVSFIQDIAKYMGLQVPNNHLLYPEDWVNNLKRLNRARRDIPGPPAEPKPSQVVEANPRT